MASQPVDNNPAGTPPEPPADRSAEILDVLSLGDSSSTADAAAAIAARAAQPAPGGPAPASEPPAGDGTAPAPAGVAPPVPPPAPAAPAIPAAPEPAPAAPSAAPAAPSAAPAAPPAAPQPPVAPPAAPAVDEAALREASLRAQVDAMQRELATLRANPQSGQPPASAPESGQPGSGEPAPVRYNLTLPQPMTQKLLSDNPEENVAAITQIVNDFGTIVHNAVLGQVRKEVADLIAPLRAAQPDPAAQAMETAREAYYTAFPVHKDATVLPLVQSEAQKMSAQFPGLPWDATYINALGARVNAAIASLGGQPQSAEPAPVAPPPNPPPARPAPMMPSGNRGAGAVTPSGDISDEIMGVLDPFATGG